MVKNGENIRHRKDGHWKHRYIKRRRTNGKAMWEYVQGHGYQEIKLRQKKKVIANALDSSTLSVFKL